MMNDRRFLVQVCQKDNIAKMDLGEAALLFETMYASPLSLANFGSTPAISQASCRPV
jgi:hypothetical protein